jgi:hypothetical protein
MPHSLVVVAVHLAKSLHVAEIRLIAPEKGLRLSIEDKKMDCDHAASYWLSRSHSASVQAEDMDGAGQIMIDQMTREIMALRTQQKSRHRIRSENLLLNPR